MILAMPILRRDKQRVVPAAAVATSILIAVGFLVGCASGPGSSSTDTAPPTAPTNLAATAASSTQINLSWGASTDNVGVTGYRVERCQGSGCSNFAQIATPTGTSFNDSGLAQSTAYSYRVRANDAAGNVSSYSNTASATTQADTTPPSAPANLTATPASNTQINLSWTASTDNVGVTGYRVERCQGSGCSNFAQIATPAATSFNDSGLLSSTAYSYRVRATDAAGNLSGYSNTASATTPSSTVTVSLSPKHAGVTTSQKQQYTATVTDPQNGGVSWSVDAINGGNSTVGTVSTTGLFTPGSQIGIHTVVATSNSNPAVSASASIAVTDLQGVFTYHNDPARTGQNLQEYALTTATVNSSTFGVLFSCPVDGYVYAQPLYIANFSIGGLTRNVVFVATEHDSVYAFDADSSSCVQLWKTSFLSSGVTTVPAADTGELSDLIPEIGITSTPVIDSSTNTIFVVAKTKETVGSGCSSGSPCYVHRLHALDMTNNGVEKFGGPVVLSAPNFVPLFHLQRPALLLSNSTLYIGFGSHGDNNTWQGWLMAYTYNSSTLTQNWVWHSTDPTSGNNEGAIWGSGNGPALDASGNIYVETGNGVFDGTSNFSDSVVKLSPAGALLDYFTPFDQDVMQSNDIDLGSSGPIILPAAVGTAGHPPMIATGKVGIVYLLDQTNMGKYNTGANQDLGEVSVGFNTSSNANGFYGQPAYWNGNIYTIIVGDSLRQFSVGNGTISTVSGSHSDNTFTFRGATPAVSASGTTTNGLVWVADITAYQSGGAVILDAYDATNVSTPLYSSPASGSGAAATAAKFTVPTVANGKVYLGGQLAFTVFGLLPN
jgi:chitodextrinase